MSDFWSYEKVFTVTIVQRKWCFLTTFALVGILNLAIWPTRTIWIPFRGLKRAFTGAIVARWPLEYVLSDVIWKFWLILLMKQMRFSQNKARFAFTIAPRDYLFFKTYFQSNFYTEKRCIWKLGRNCKLHYT